MWLCSAHMNEYLPSFHFDIDSLEYCTCRYYQLWILIVYLTSRLSIFLYNIDTSLFNRSIDRFSYRSLPLAGPVWMTSEMIEHWLSLPIAISRPSKDDCKRKITKGFVFPASRRLGFLAELMSLEYNRWLSLHSSRVVRLPMLNICRKIFE